MTFTTRPRRKSPEERRLAREILPTPVDKAIQFYIEHYVIGLPDEARVGQELQGVRWLHAPSTREIMAAVGMAGLSNLTGDRQLSTRAKQHYGLALQNITSSIRDMAGLDLEVVLRAVVMMAMYEVSSLLGGAPNHPEDSNGLTDTTVRSLAVETSLLARRGLT
jgi:hypothetical protein